jgi:large subunit ribosomal protein L30
MAARLRVTLHKSVVSTTKEARGTVRALGLHRIGHTVEVPDNAATRGMVRAVRYLVTTEEIADDGPAVTAAAPTSRTRRTREKAT